MLFPRKPGVLGSWRADSSCRWDGSHISQPHCNPAPSCSRVLIVGQESSVLAGSFERRADEGTSSCLWHDHWLFGSSMVDAQPVPGSQWEQGSAPRDQSWGL